MDIIQSARELGQIKEPCTQCGGIAMHRVNDYQLCCECYIKAGNTPADWHPECCKWHLKLHPPKRWKFTIGDSVKVNGRGHNNEEAYITGCSGNGYELYEVVFKKTGYHAAWLCLNELTLFDEKDDIDALRARVRELENKIKDARRTGYDDGYDEGYQDGLSEHEE